MKKVVLFYNGEKVEKPLKGIKKFIEALDNIGVRDITIIRGSTGKKLTGYMNVDNEELDVSKKKREGK